MIVTAVRPHVATNTLPAADAPAHEPEPTPVAQNTAPSPLASVYRQQQLDLLAGLEKRSISNVTIKEHRPIPRVESAEDRATREINENIR